MTGLIAVGLMGVAVVFTLLPVPLWVSRARRRKPALALEPGGDDKSLVELERRSPSLGAVARDARIIAAALDHPIDATADVRASAPYLRWQAVVLTTVSQGWASDVVDAFEHARVDAVQLVRLWLENVYRLGEDDRRAIEATGMTPGVIDQLVRDVESLVMPRDVARSRALFEAVRDSIKAVELGLLGRGLTPYR